MLTYYIHQKRPVGSWHDFFQPCTQPTGSPFWLRKSHLKSNFDQNKSNIFVPPAQPQDDCCFPDGDAFLYVDSSPRLAAAACSRWCEGLCCLCTTSAKIRGDTESCGRWSVPMWQTIKYYPVAHFFFFFFPFPSFLSAGTWHLLGNVGLEPAGRGSSWKLLGFLFRELSASFAQTMNKVLFLAFKKQRRVGGMVGLCSTDFPTIPNLWKGNRSVLSSFNMGQRAKIQSSNSTAGAKSHPDRQCLLYYKQVKSLISSSGYFAQIPQVLNGTQHLQM